MAETSETNYKFTLHNIPEERSQPMKSQNTNILRHTLCWIIQNFWDVTLCRWLSSFTRSEGSYSLHLQGSRFFLDSLRVKVNALRSSETSRTTHPTTESHPRRPKPTETTLREPSNHANVFWSLLSTHSKVPCDFIIFANTTLTRFPIYHDCQYIYY